MDARFLRACHTPAELPPPSLLEVAVAGRSNCGKSSLINAVTGQSRLARVSSTPGRTQQIVFFFVQPATGEALHLVDLPGYGYAKSSKISQRDWAALVNHYIATRETLRVLLLLNDIRREPRVEEQDLLRWATERSLTPLVVLTKADKLSKSERRLAVDRAKRSFELPRRPLCCSIHDRESIDELRDALVSAVALAPEP
jgi:GTP-binding protein